MLKLIEGGLTKREGWFNHDCYQPFHVEICFPDGTKMKYQVDATDVEDAREQAKNLVHNMVEAYMDKRIAWRIQGDRKWSFCSARMVQRSKPIIERIKDYFFPYEEC